MATSCRTGHRESYRRSAQNIERGELQQWRNETKHRNAQLPASLPALGPVSSAVKMFAAEVLTGPRARVGAVDKGMTHIPGRETSSCYSQGPQFQAPEFIISGTSHLIFSDGGWLRGIETSDEGAGAGLL